MQDTEAQHPVLRRLSFVQTTDLNREAQHMHAANKDWLEAHLDEAWLWAKLP